jgi:hypothetical protein
LSGVHYLGLTPRGVVPVGGLAHRGKFWSTRSCMFKPEMLEMQVSPPPPRGGWFLESYREKSCWQVPTVRRAEGNGRLGVKNAAWVRPEVEALSSGVTLVVQMVTD